MVACQAAAAQAEGVGCDDSRINSVCCCRYGLLLLLLLSLLLQNTVAPGTAAAAADPMHQSRKQQHGVRFRVECQPCTLYPALCTLNPKPCTLNHDP